MKDAWPRVFFSMKEVFVTIKETFVMKKQKDHTRGATDLLRRIQPRRDEAKAG